MTDRSSQRYVKAALAAYAVTGPCGYISNFHVHWISFYSRAKISVNFSDRGPDTDLYLQCLWVQTLQNHFRHEPLNYKGVDQCQEPLNPYNNNNNTSIYYITRLHVGLISAAYLYNCNVQLWAVTALRYFIIIIIIIIQI